MKQLSIASLVLALLSLAPAAGAQTATPYMTVDEISVGSYAIAVTGVVQGEAAPSTHSFSPGYGDAAQQAAAIDRCHRTLLLALGKPGQYVAKIGQNLCTLARVAP